MSFSERAISDIEVLAPVTVFLKRPEQLKSLITDMLRLNPHTLSTNANEKESILYGIQIDNLTAVYQFEKSEGSIHVLSVSRTKRGLKLRSAAWYKEQKKLTDSS